MDKALLKHCRYYDGGENPPADAPYEPVQRFWYLERQYYNGDYITRREYWEEGEGMRMLLGDYPEHWKEFFDKNNFDKTTRGFIAFSVIMIVYNSPMDNCEFIFDYGKK